MASEATDSKEKMATSLEANMLYMNKVIKADKNFDVISVSYTHLDVYKRQDM